MGGRTLPPASTGRVRRGAVGCGVFPAALMGVNVCHRRLTWCRAEGAPVRVADAEGSKDAIVTGRATIAGRDRECSAGRRSGVRGEADPGNRGPPPAPADGSRSWMPVAGDVHGP